MKNIITLIAFSIIQSISFGQVEFSLPSQPLIYDLPGSTFLVTYTNNGKAFASELDATGNIIWTDSIAFLGGAVYEELLNTSQFTGTDEFLVTMYKSDDYPSAFLDTLIYQHSKLSISNQGFTNYVMDTVFQRRHFDMALLPMPDTTIKMFYIDSSSYPYRFAANSIDQNLNIFNITFSDSIVSYDFTNYFRSYQNTIRFLTNPGLGSGYKVQNYTDSISLINEYSYIIPSPEYYKRTSYFDFISDDSIFVFMESWTNGLPIEYFWDFAFLDSNLNELQRIRILSPYNNDSSRTYTTFLGTIIVDGLIYVYATSEDYYAPSTPGVDLGKIFVYDYDVNLVCEIPVNLTPLYSIHLKALNNKPYLKLGRDYYPINICSSITSVDEIEVDFDVLVYPNPTNNNVKINIGKASEMDILVFDMLGKIKISTHTNKKVTEISLENFSKGVYFIKIGNDYNSITKKIIKN